MQAPDPANPGGGFLHSNAPPQPLNPVAPMIPRTGLPLTQGGPQFSPYISPRPIFSVDSSSGHRAAVPLVMPSVSTGVAMGNLAPSNSANPIPINPQFGLPPQAHSSVQMKCSVAANIPQPVLNVNPPDSSSPSQHIIAHSTAVTTSVISAPMGQVSIGGISVAASAPLPAATSATVSGVVPPMMLPPVAHHTSGITPFGQTQLPSFMSRSNTTQHLIAPPVAPVPPIQHLGAHHRPIQAVQPQQVPVVQPVLPSGAAAMSHGGPHTGQQAQQFQRLKVEDALSYLDQVKLQFGNHPQVYNDFLDIMKEFKSQSIDTPGVISRVSNLFKGHPELIVGFNTFLPPGYKIEVQANDTISVQQPGQPSMSLSQLTGASSSSRDHGHPLPPHHPSFKVKPVNLSVNAPGASSSLHSDIPRSGLDNVVAAAAATDAISSSPGQPVEFNHAISYVNKIKNRFQGQPEIYKNFLEILHKYQKEQKLIKDGTIAPSGKPLTETEVYSQVAKLFQNQEDLLKEFGQFLPDANGQGGYFNKVGLSMDRDMPPMKAKPFSMTNKRESSHSKLSSSSSSMRKFGNSGVSGIPSKKPKVSNPGRIGNKDISMAEAGKYGSLSEYAFFDKVRKVLRYQDVYDNFLRCLLLFNQDVVSRIELIQLTQPFLGKYPELYRRFKDLILLKDSAAVVEAVASPSALTGQPKAERMMRDDLSMEIDYSSCKRYGHSYRGLPKSYHPPRCSGRTTLCREVLNDTWVSFPSWSEESTFVTSRKTQFEESIYRCEDERFELDVVIELNLATIKVLEGVQKKLQRMTSDEAAKFKLDNTLGGGSEVIHRKAIHRIYGDKAVDIIDGLKKNPVVAVPLVLRRLKSKDDEWKEAQRQFNKIWREQNEKYYLKSLDHQAINFKQNDVKSLRSKSLLNEIEAIYDAEQTVRKDTENTAADDPLPLAPTSEEAEKKPHLKFTYRDTSMVDDAMSLVIHHARRQSSVQKEDKQLIKQLMRQKIQRFFHRSTLPLSDDEDDDEDSEEEEREDSKPSSPNPTATPCDGKPRRSSSRGKVTSSSAAEEKKSPIKTELMELEAEHVEIPAGAEWYSLFYANSNWYLFLRLHQILCHRLHQIKLVCDRLVEENAKCKKDKSESVAVALRLRLPLDLEPEQYYNNFLDLVKSLLDGNIESTQYEDHLRELFGIHAYITFTMDKLIQNIVKQLQHIVTDELCRDVTDSWIRESSNHATGGDLKTREERCVAESAYKKKLEGMLSEDNCFEITMYKKDNILTVTLLDTDMEGSVATGVGQTERWNDYIDKFVPGELDPDLSDDVKEHLKRKPIMLRRNIEGWKRSHHATLNNSKSAAELNETKPTAADDSDDKMAKDMETDAEQPDTAETTILTDDAAEAKMQAEGDEDDPRLPPGLDVLEGQQCRFDPSSFKIVQVVKSEDFLYRAEALTRAAKTHKKVSHTLYKQWDQFCSQWREENTTPVESCRITAWLKGEDLEDCRPCRTTCKCDNDLEKAPYRVYNRYSVRYEKVSTVIACVDDGSITALSAASDEAMDTL